MLILDEVTAGLDPQTEAEIVETIRQLKRTVTILVISHQTELVEAADLSYTLTDRTVIESHKTASMFHKSRKF